MTVSPAPALDPAQAVRGLGDRRPVASLYAHARNAPGRSFDCASPEPEIRQLIEDGFIRQVSAGLFEIGDRGISLVEPKGAVMRRNRAETPAYEAAKTLVREAMILGGSSQDDGDRSRPASACERRGAGCFASYGVKRVCATPEAAAARFKALGPVQEVPPANRSGRRKQGSSGPLSDRTRLRPGGLRSRTPAASARHTNAAGPPRTRLLIAENDALKRRVAELEAELADELDGVGKRESRRVRDLVDQLRDAQGSRDLIQERMRRLGACV